MKLNGLLLLIIIVGFIIIAQSCEKENGNETKISSYEGDDSHKAGQNCMNCHKNGGSGEGWFKQAGTIYDELKTTTYPNATVRLYTGPNGTGTLIQTIEVDANGNFYTTEGIDFGTGLYTSVQGNTTTKNMVSLITNGQCNSCHGVDNRIWTK